MNFATRNRDWKWRSKGNKGKRYSIRIHRNYLDARFCPVLWLLKWLSVSGIKSGPIFQTKVDGKFSGMAPNEDWWCGKTTTLFTKVRKVTAPSPNTKY